MLGSSRQIFLQQAAQTVDDGPALTDSLADFLTLLKNPKALEKLVQKALVAVKDIEKAERTKLDLIAEQSKAEADLAATRVEIGKLRSEHDRPIAQREVEISAREKRASDLFKQAEADAVKAKADRGSRTPACESRSCNFRRRVMPTAYRENGVIRKMADDGMFGFIENAQSRDIYFHHTRVLPGSEPKVGREVRFTLQNDKRGWRAIDIEVLRCR